MIAVYANTLVFSGRVFALAFFRIEGVALKLLRALPSVKRQFLTRVLDEAGVQEESVFFLLFPPTVTTETDIVNALVRCLKSTLKHFLRTCGVYAFEISGHMSRYFYRLFRNRQLRTITSLSRMGMSLLR